jgi:alpha-ketoglutaric semialdehyde dehydrogenase
MTGAGPVAVGHHIGGRWTPPREELGQSDPARPGARVSSAPIATDGEVDRAVAAAHDAGAAWRALGPIERGEVLHTAAASTARCSDELVDLLVREAGKLIADARGEVARAVATFRYNAERVRAATGELFASSDPTEEVRTLRVPLGVVALVTPWNFPVAIPVWKLAPALVHGNTVVWKPAPQTPAVSAALMRILADAGLPDGVCNLIHGDAWVGRRLVDSPWVAAVSFTGSSATGEDVAARARAHGARHQLECGGHNPALVFADADLDVAADQIIAGAMLAAGQKCTATRRAILASEIHDEMLDRLVERAAKLRVGAPRDEDTQVGPLISAAARDRVVGVVAAAQDAGDELLTGGRPLDDASLDGGHYLSPAVLRVVQPATSPLCRDETFGPVLAVLAMSDEDHGIALANATGYGLTAAVFTRDQRRIVRMLAEIEVGVLHINGPTTGAELHVPFGGVKRSGSAAWREQGESAREFFTQQRTAYLRPG